MFWCRHSWDRLTQRKYSLLKWCKMLWFLFIWEFQNTIVYRQFLQLDQCRNIPPWWVGKECEVQYFPSSPFGFHGYPAFIIETIKQMPAIYYVNEYQLLPQYWGKLDFSCLHPLCWSLQSLETLKNWLKCHQGRECLSAGWNWGSSLCFQTRGDALPLPQSLQCLHCPRWLQQEFHSLWISSARGT